MPSKQNISIHHLITGILFCSIMVVAFMQRIDTVYLWKELPEQFLVHREPMLANLDGYYYLNIAQEIKDNTYSSVDLHRAWPEQVHRPGTPPLLSVIIATVANITHTSLNTTAVFIPAALSVLLALPLFLFGYRLGGGIGGVTAPVIALLAPVYVSRTSLAVLDTDCMNVTFALTCAYLFMRFSLEPDRKRYYFLAGGLATSLFFFWWWDQAPAAVTALAFSPLALGLILFFRPGKKERVLFLSVVAVSLVLLLAILGWQKPVQLFSSLLHQLSYISGKTTDLYPNIGNFITEQASMSLPLLMKGTGIMVPVFLIGCFGFMLAGFKQFKQVIFLLPIFFVGLLSLQAMRFAIFLIPVIALGFSYILSLVYTALQKNHLIPWIYAVLVGFIGWQGVAASPMRTSYFDGKIIAGMQRVQTLTPENAVIWSWWDEGHPLVYWSRRATINDGMVHSGQRTHYTAIPMSFKSPRLAANFMQFYAVRGIKGITQFFTALKETGSDKEKLLMKILALGPGSADDEIAGLPLRPGHTLPKNLERFFFPDSSPPLYLFLDKRLLKQTQHIYWYGTWDTVQQSGTKTLPVINIENIPFDHQGHPDSTTFSLNYTNGMIQIPSMLREPVPVKQVVTTDNAKSITNTYDSPPAVPKMSRYLQQYNPVKSVLADQGYYVLDLSIQARHGILLDQKMAEAMVHRMYWRKNIAVSPYFQLIEEKLPYYQIWKVKGDVVHGNEDLHEYQHIPKDKPKS